ncbi:hypothetical protein NMG60_11033105 [Bertholletia excelsa]
MENGINEIEFDEFEKLLGEIPNVTSGTPHAEEAGLINSLKDLKRPSLDDSLSLQCPRSLCEKLQSTATLSEGKLSVNEIQQLNMKRVQREEPNLPDDQSLTSAFAELSFNEGATIGAANPPLVNFNSLHNQTVLLNGPYSNGLMKLPSNVDSRAKFVPPGQSHNNSSNSFERFEEKRGSQSVGYYQPVQNFSGSAPFNHGLQSFQFLSNMPVHGVEFPIYSDPQQYFRESQSSLPYLHSQQPTQPRPHVTWRHMEEGQCYRMQQYMYMQRLRSQQLEAQHPNGKLVARLMGQSLQQPRKEAMWNKAPVSRSMSQSNHVLSSTDFNRVQVLDKNGKTNFPEKILTRSHGLNSLKSVKFGSFCGNELLFDANKSGRVFSNGQYHPNFSDSKNAACQLDNISLQGSVLDTADLKHNNSRPLFPKYNSIDEIVGRIYVMAKDQHGCRFLQRKFTEGSKEDIEKIFLEIIVHIVELMTDPFGNYLVQKLLEVCNEDQLMQILQAVTQKSGDLVRISCDMHGTRAVQKVIETLKTPEQFSMVVSSLKPGIVTLIKNTNGNHVAQRCLQYLKAEYSEFLFEAAIANCVELATDRHGCCVLQKCLSHSDDCDQRNHLICEITSNALILSQDPFGNYVVQFVFEINVPWAMVDILDQLDGNYGDLSVQKYSSNVVEKCLKHAGEERRCHIIQELINNPHLDQIMQDPYGNYVIQAALNLSKGTLHAALVEAIRPHVPMLRTSPYGKKVLSSNSMKK